MSTTITINTHEVSRRECAALIVLLNALHPSAAAEPIAPTVTTGFGAQKCREAYENTYHKVAADIPFDVWEFVWKKAHGVSATSPGKYVAARIPADMPTPEITALLADLNAELYSRRVIKPDDNPAAGVELPAAAVAGMDDMASHGADAFRMAAAGDSFAKTEVTVKAGDDLASIFGAAATDPDAASGDIGAPIKSIDPAHIGATVDKNGLPWDARIHAASKAINADGTWRQKRNVAPELVATVEAQLRGVMAVPVPPVASGKVDCGEAGRDEGRCGNAECLPGGDAGPTIEEINFPGALREGAPITPPPPPPAATVLPPPPPRSPEADHQAAMADVAARRASTDPTTFPELVAYITAQKVAGKLAQTQLDAALVAIGVQGALPVMAARPDLIPTLVAKLRVLAGA